MERLIETESAIMILLGLLIGANFGRKWLVFPLFSTAMLIVHNTRVSILSYRCFDAWVSGVLTKLA